MSSGPENLSGKIITPDSPLGPGRIAYLALKALTTKLSLVLLDQNWNMSFLGFIASTSMCFSCWKCAYLLWNLSPVLPSFPLAGKTCFAEFSFCQKYETNLIFFHFDKLSNILFSNSNSLTQFVVKISWMIGLSRIYITMQIAKYYWNKQTALLTYITKLSMIISEWSFIISILFHYLFYCS